MTAPIVHAAPPGSRSLCACGTKLDVNQPAAYGAKLRSYCDSKLQQSLLATFVTVVCTELTSRSTVSKPRVKLPTQLGCATNCSIQHKHECRGVALLGLNADSGKADPSAH